MQERYLQSKILKALRSTGGWWVKFHVGPRYGTAGVPDILGCYEGVFIALEVKRPGGKPTELQAAVQQKIRKMGKGVVRTVTSVDEALAVVYAIRRRKTLDGKRKKQVQDR